MADENIERLNNILAGMDDDSGTELTTLFRDDSAWAQMRESLEPFVQPDCEFVWIASFGQMEHRGLDGLREGWLDWYAPWSTYRSKIEDVINLGDDRVMVLVRERARREDGTADVEMRPAGLFTFRDGKLARIDFYASRDEAFEAVRG